MRRLALLVLLLAACPQTPPAGTSAGATTGTTGGDGTSGSTTDVCMRSGDCESGGICVSEFVPDPTGGLGGSRGPAICLSPDDCIGALDLARWCFDHQACCGDLRCHPGDGICEPPDLGVTSGGMTTGDGTTGDGTTGTTDTDTGTTGTGGESTGGSTSGTTAASTG